LLLLYLYWCILSAFAQTFSQISTALLDNPEYNFNVGSYSSQYDKMHSNVANFGSNYQNEYQKSVDKNDPFNTANSFVVEYAGITQDDLQREKWYKYDTRLTAMREKFEANKQTELVEWVDCVFKYHTNPGKCKSELADSYVTYAKSKESEHKVELTSDFEKIKLQNTFNDGTQILARDKDLGNWFKCMEKKNPELLKYTSSEDPCKNQFDKVCESRNSTKCQDLHRIRGKIDFIDDFHKLDPSKSEQYKGKLDVVQYNLFNISAIENKKLTADHLEKLKNESASCNPGLSESSIGSSSLVTGGKLNGSSIESSMSKIKYKDQGGLGVCYAASASSNIEANTGKSASYLHIAILYSDDKIDKADPLKSADDYWVNGGDPCDSFNHARKSGVCPAETSWVEMGASIPGCKENCEVKQDEVMKLLQNFFISRKGLSDADRSRLSEMIKNSKTANKKSNTDACYTPEIRKAFEDYKKLLELAGDAVNATEVLSQTNKTNSEMMTQFLFPTCTDSNKIKYDNVECKPAYDVDDGIIPKPARKDVLIDELKKSLAKGQPLSVGYCHLVATSSSNDCSSGHAILLTGISYDKEKGCMIQTWNSWGDYSQLKEYPASEFANYLLSIGKTQEITK
jgi:hypothetical protein